MEAPGNLAVYGPLGIVSAILFGMVWRILIWVFEFVKTINSQQNSERQIWLATLNKQSDTLTKICENLDKHDKRADERGNYVREEHSKMIDSLTKIIGARS